MDIHFPQTIDEETLHIVPERIVRQFLVLPIKHDETSVTLCCPDDPDYAIHNEEEIRFALNRNILWQAVPRHLLELEIDRYFPQSKPDIQNCDIRFRFRCPKQWSQLTPTKNPGERKCTECNRMVFRCHTKSEVQWQARQGHCVAFISLDECQSDLLGEPDDDQ